MPRIDLTGHQYNKLTVLRFSHVDNHQATQWVCRCECGRETTVRSNDLRRGGTTSCGCNKYHYHIEGMRFGKWLVISRDPTREAIWICRCECGTLRSKRFDALQKTRGGCSSCGNGKRDLSLIGKKYGQLTVLRFSHVQKEHCYFVVRCDCGVEKIVQGLGLKNGLRSCGCSRRKKRK